MDERAKQLKREYQRQYRENNREQINEAKRKWRAKNADKVREKVREWNAKNPDKLKQYRDNYWNRKAMEAGTICLYCGDTFEPKRSDAKFCKTSCRVSYNRKQKKQ